MKCNCDKNCGELTGLAHIGIYTADIEKSIHFYRDVLGFELFYTKEITTPSGTIQLAFVRTGSCIVELIQPAHAEEVEGKSNGVIDHIAIEAKDLDQLVCRLWDEGVAFETDHVTELPNLFNGVKNIFCKGPNGERLEFFEYK
ncbi:MAG: VOC family protein [Clostridia bacterium]|jgi:lactoylglutathione lyase